ncbi:LytTR family DNA-binding domain-containing protein [Undibacterium sp. TS12]|uniref:LytR/AlgR family response regulator transcription factor n=1 Tax=Undibacterium sp. TS12 TaxID=2908202 RepID=UPI001F4CD07D|nr:LytTR family DNA-binding domain-containing protein [Undibacterium sp. TS12]MCH8620510.1 LytTR family DNA-binding domain-containing protein [Undibacterium sp. TS12]
MRPHSTNIRILIADDEPMLRAELRESLSLLWPEAQIVGEAADGIEALRMARELSPDVAFLDIRMPGMSGMDVARTFGSRTHVVFVTAYQEHAVAAFEEGALDYVVKPASAARLARTINRVRERIITPPPDLSAVMQKLDPKPTAPTWLQASVGNTIHFIDLSDVIYFKSELKYTRIVTDKMEAHIRTPIKDLAASLEEAGFWQIHRSYVVAVKRIASVIRDQDAAVWLNLRDHAVRLPVSQRYQHRFKGM